MSVTKAKTKTVEGVHPKEHTVNLAMTDGTTIQILTSWGKEGETLRLDVDPKNHPAWQDKAQNFMESKNDRVNKFKSRFGNFGFGDTPAEDKKAN